MFIVFFSGPTPLNPILKCRPDLSLLGHPQMKQDLFSLPFNPDRVIASKRLGKSHGPRFPPYFSPSIPPSSLCFPPFSLPPPFPPPFSPFCFWPFFAPSSPPRFPLPFSSPHLSPFVPLFPPRIPNLGSEEGKGPHPHTLSLTKKRHVLLRAHFVLTKNLRHFTTRPLSVYFTEKNALPKGNLSKDEIGPH